MLVDTHCHIHEADYPLDKSAVLVNAHERLVDIVLCVGTSEASSQLAVDFALANDEAYAVIGVHPHDTKDGWTGISKIADETLASEAGRRKLVAVGEIGLDYFYNHSPRETQIKALEEQIAIALKHDLAISFHVREAFDDFWPIFDSFKGIRGVIHSFTDNDANLQAALDRGLCIGINGISTFTKDADQKRRYASVPLDRLLLETDAPFLTPAPFRGKVNQPAFIRNIAEHHAELLGVDLESVMSATTTNAKALFRL